MIKIYVTSAKKKSVSIINSHLGVFRLFMLLGFFCLYNFSGIYAQTYVNGNVSTGSVNSAATSAPAGSTWSEMQFGNNTYGAPASAGTTVVADDFTVCSNWTVNSFTLYAYITVPLATSTPGYLTGCPFGHVRLAIYNVDPSIGSPTPIYGDLSGVTDYFNTSTRPAIYRISNAATDYSREVWGITCNTPGLSLVASATKYWVVYSIENVAPATYVSYVPLSTVAGSLTQPGNNAKYKNISSGIWTNITDGQSFTAQDLPFAINYTSTSCSGVPAPGASITSNAGPLCPSINFTLSMANPNCQSGVSYQWKVSIDGGTTYTSIAGATATTLTTNFATLGISSSIATVKFRCDVTCSNGGSMTSSTPITVTQNSLFNCYCTSTATSTADEDISNVTFGSLNNTSSCSSVGPGPGSAQYFYANYTSGAGAPSPAQVYSGINNPFSVSIVTCGGTYPNAVRVWIDFNHDGVLDNTTERVYNSSYTTGPHTETGAIFIPSTALTGQTLMRVVNFESFSVPAGPCNNYTWGETEDYLINITPATACSGTPNVGSTLASPSSVCPGNPFTLSTSNAASLASFSGVTYQWYSSPDNATWTPITGATNATYSTSQSALTYYRMMATCSFGGGTFTSTSFAVNMNAATFCYCTPGTTNSGDNDIAINVTFACINNSSANSPNGGYSDYTSSVPAGTAYRGVGNPISVTIPSGYSEYVSVWIDYNHSGSFDTDEYTPLGNTTSAGGTITNVINIPSSALLGSTRMRVRVRYASQLGSTETCNGYTWGETEDYTVNIQDPVACSSITFGTMSSNISSACPGERVVVSASNSCVLQGITGLALQWQVSTDGGGTWSSATGTGTTTPTLTTTITSTSLFRLQGTCSSTITSPSVTVSLTPPTGCYCASTANFSNYTDILNVTVGSLNNTSDCASSAPGPGSIANRYSNYTAGAGAPAPGNIFSGTSNPFSVSIGSCTFSIATGVAIWIDLDKSGTFEDATEKLYLSSISSSTMPRTESGVLVIPATTALGDTIRGITRMRIVNNTNSLGSISACGSYSYGETEDYLVNIQFAPECTGAFVPTIASTATTVCPSVPFTLNIQNSTGLSGITFQWQSSTDNTTWAPIVGATNITYTTTISVNTYFRVVATCNASATITPSSSLLISSNGSAGCFCQPTTTSGAVDAINNVTFGGINNNSAYVVPGYSNYTNTLTPGTAIRGGSNSISVTISTGSNLIEYVAAWIDYNHDGAFTASEYTGLQSVLNGGISTGNINIPLSALNGITRLRVRVRRSTSLGSGDACTGYTNGETEDYPINIVSCSQVDIDQSPFSTLVSCGVNAVFNVFASSASTIPVKYQWLVRTTPTGPWTVVVNGANYTGFDSTALVVINPPISFSGYSYAVAMNSSCTAQDTSASAILTVNPAGTTTFSTQPANVTANCNTPSVSFNFVASLSGTPVYKWQFRSGPLASWSNLVNNATFSNVTTNTLTVSNIINGFNGYQFRAYASSPCYNADTTSIATLTVNPITLTLSILSNAPSNTACYGVPVTFTATAGSSAPINLPGYKWYIDNIATASAASVGTTINVASTAQLAPLMNVTVASGFGTFFSGTFITSIINATSFTVNTAPFIALQNGDVISGLVANGATFVNYTSSTLVNGNIIRCTLIANDPTLCTTPNPATSNIINMNITSNTLTSVAVVASPGNIVCAGDNVTFTATPTNGGATPVYQWKKNGVNVGTNSNTYSNNALANLDVITVVMTSNASGCNAPNPATSTPITMTVNQSFPVSVTISADPGVSTCPGVPVTFIATPVNGGTTPAYQWQLSTDGGASYTNVGTNSINYTTSALVTSNIIKCILTSSISSCTQGTNPATSNLLTMSVTSQAASVTITSNPLPGNVCAGSSVIYTANGVNDGGAGAVYQFYVNGVAVSNTGTTYSYIPAEGDSISVSMASAFACASPNPATAYVKQTLKAKPTASISLSSLTCASNSATLDAGATAGSGTITAYQWYLGGVSQSGGTISTFYTTTNGNYTVQVTNSNGCTFTSPAYSLTVAAGAQMAGTYTIGAVTATVASVSGNTITASSATGLVVGAVITKLSGTITIPANTVITSVSGLTFTVNNAPTGFVTSAVLVGATCTNYINFTTAVADLNNRGISASCVFNVTPGFSENLTARLDLGNPTLSGQLSSTKTIIFQKSGAGTNPVINAYTTGTATPASGIPDGIWALSGIDYVTIDGINLADGNAANPATMEYGYGLFRRTNTDGAQNNTIKNCTITLNKLNNATPAGAMPGGSAGIMIINSISTDATNPAYGAGGTSGANSNNKFYTNTIQNCNYGIYATGFAATNTGTTPADGDFGNDIGGASASTGNIIINFGGGATINASAGVTMNNQWGSNASFNTINNNNGSGTNHAGIALRGIYGQAGVSANVTINNNNITINGGGNIACYGIDNGIGSTAASNTVNINNNTVTGGNTLSTSQTYFAVYNTAVCTNLNINGNTVQNCIFPASTGEWKGINNLGAACVNVNMNNNTITNNNIASTNIACNFLFTAGVTGTPNPVCNMNGNIITNNTRTATAATSTTNMIVLQSGTAGVTSATISNNIISDNTVNVTAGAAAFELSAIFIGTNNLTIQNNTIRKVGINNNIAGTTIMTVNGFRGVNSSTNETISGNFIRQLFVSTTASTVSTALHVINGIYTNSGGSTKNIYNNNIDSLYASSAYSATIFGIRNNTGTAVNIFKNKITNLFPGQSATAGSIASGIRIASSSANSTVNVYNNMIALDLTGAFSPASATALNTADGLRGIDLTTTSVTSTINLSYNSIRLAGTGTTLFGSSGIYQTDAALGSANLFMKNNIISNECTKVGAAYSVAFRRSASTSANYSNTSNYNLFYAGIDTTIGKLFMATAAGTDFAGNIAKLRTRLGSESAGQSAKPGFISNNDLHLNVCDGNNGSYIDGKATPISITDDIDAELRSGTTPDIGADEISANSAAGIVSSNATVCAGNNSGTLTLSGYNGVIQNWQSASDAAFTTNVNAIANLTATYTYSNITTTTYYRAVLTSSCGGTTVYALPALITVNPSPAITSIALGTITVCINATIQLTGASPALVSPWTSSNTAVASISNTGLVTGLTAGNSTIRFTNTNGCYKDTLITVNALPIISGTLSACVGSGSQLTGSGTPAGSNPWTSANTAIATVSTTGVVTGVAAGSVNITYTNISGCSAVVNVTVSDKPPVTGTTSLCVGSSTTLTGTPGAGSVQTPTWTASNANATINGSGFLTGVNAGLDTIRYTNTFGCYKDTAITINASPTLTGASTVCVGSTITLVGSASPATPSTATTPWQSSNATIASVANAVSVNGVVTGVAAGNCSITYTNTNGCAKTNLITVNPKPSAFNVTGTGSYCIGLPGIAVGLSGSQAGINYELIKGGVATGNIVAGTNAAISFGIQTIGTYTVSATNATTGCASTMTGNAVIANYPLTTITGTMTLCVGNTTTLTGSPAGSTNPWISNHSEFATITSGGLVTAIAAGTDTIRYNDINGCQTDTPFIITPPTVGGTVSSSANVCTGTNTGTLRLTGYSGSVVRWEYSTDLGLTWTAVANITDSLIYTNLTATRKYRAVVKSGLCSEANSSQVTITVSPVPTIFTVTGGGTRCEGSSTGLPVGLSGSQTSTTYLLVFDGFSSGITRVGTGGAITFGNYISAGTYTVLAINAYSCISTMTGSVTIIENPRPTANITQTGPINICSPATQVLNISTTAASPVYQWYADGILIVGATASSYTAGGLGTTIYSVIASSSATTCVSLKSRGVVVTVNSKPSNVLINPDSIGICSGGNATLSVSNDPITGDAVAMLEDFNDTASLKWTVSDGVTSPLQSGWGLYEVPYYKSTGNPTFSNFSTQNGGWFALADADAGGGGSTTLTILYSDTFSLANYNSAILSFEHSLQRYSADSSIRIEMSKDGGVTWDTATPVKNYMLGGSIGSNFSTANESINIDPSYLGLSNLMMRFYYKSSYGYYWLIDNVKVSGIKSYASSYTWSPALGLNTTSGSTVVASPLVNTSYIATATSSLGCFAKDTADVTLKPRPSMTTEPNDTAVCIGAPVFFISADADGIGTLNYQWYSNTSNVYAGATLLLGENGSSYSPSAVTAGIKYYFAIIAADCGSDSSRIAKITVNDNTTVTTEPLSPAPVCVNGTAPVLTVVATGGALTYQWFSNTTNTHVGSTLIPGASLASYTPPVTVVDTLFYYVVVTGTCATDTSNAAEVMVRGNTSITTQPVTPAAVCINGTAPILSVTATGTTLTYLWYSNVANNNTSGTSIPTATNSTYTPPVTAAGTLYYYVVVTGACGPVTSNAVAVLVNPNNTVTLTSAPGTINQNTCSGTAITPITYNTTGATGATFASLPAGVSGAWAANVVTISGTPTVSGVFNYIVTLTGGCGAITTGGTLTISTGNIGPLAAGTYYIPVRSCSDFPTISAAVSYLNTNGIANTSGNWIFKVDSNYIETLTSTLALGNSTLNSGINGVSATKHIVFQKNGVGNNPKVIAYPGTQASFNVAIPDGIWSLRGVDYVTIDGIDLQDNIASGNAMMEYGYGLFKTGVADGAQNDTIRNCVISLNRNNVATGATMNFDGSVGIAVLNTLATTANTAVVPNAVSGANSNNKFFKNTIQNCNIGIGINGFGAASIAAFADGGNSIGDSLSATSGNQMINFGGGTSAAVTSYGIYIKNQIDAVVAYNTVNNHVDINGADHPAAQTGIEATGFAATTGIGIKGNNITINGGGDKNYIGINNTTGGGGTVNITENFVSVKIPNTITTTAAGSVTGIKNANNSAVATLSISGNSFKRSTISGVGNWTAIYNTGTSTSVGTINMNSNIIDSNEIKSTGALIALQNDGSPYLTLNMNGNSVTRNSKAVSSASAPDYSWIKNSATSANINIQNNLIEKDTAIVLSTNGSTSTITGVRISGANLSNTITVSNNTIRSLSILGINSTFAANIRGYYNQLNGVAMNENIISNKISNLYISPAIGSSGTHTINGIQSVGPLVGGTPCIKYINLNAVDTFYVRNNGEALPQYNSTFAGICNSNNASNGSNLYIYRNKISHLIPFGTGVTTISRGIWLGSLQAAGNAYIYNNMINLDLSEAFDGASTGSSLTATDAIRGIDISQTSTSNALLYFNTIRIAGAGNATSGFGSSALSLSSASGTPNVTLRNNILVNKATAGATGYAVALRKSLAGIVYNNTSSNNLFYVDTTGRRYMYYELSTGFNSLTGAWNASSRELASVTTAEPSFIKATDGTDSLHLNIVTNCAMSGTGITIAIPSITNDIDNDTRNNPPAMGADEFTSTGQGIGNWSGVNSNWNDPINWCGLVPNSLTDVVIPISRTNYPIINATTTPIPLCRNITVNNGGTVNVLTGGKISIYGNTSTLAGGIFNTKLGTVEFDGSVAQTVGASTFQNNNVRNIIINNSSATGVTLGGPLNLLGKLSFAGSNRIFATAGNLTMKSSDTLTANLGDITKDALNGTVVSGNQVTGDVMVERFVSGWRAWRLLSMPTTHNLQTIKEAWQENQAANSTTPAGYGIQITKDSANWNTTGFDLQTTPGPSVKYFVTAPSDGGNWKGITSTIDVPGVSNGKFEAGKAYMTFYRGDRTVNTYIASQVTTTSILREKGQLFTNNYGPVSVPAHQFIAIGNPYASAIDFTKFDNVNIDGFIWLWDPKINNLGAYQTINPTNGQMTPGGGSYSPTPLDPTTHPVIESGQGFFVHNGTSSAGQITLKESSKADGSNLVTRNSSVSQQLRTNFYKLVSNNYKIYDGVLNVFDENNSNEVDRNDAIKFTYLGENLSLGRSDKLLAIENRSSLQESDTLFYKLGQVKVSTYQIEFIPENLDQTGLRAYLEDRYLNTSTPVSLTDTTRVDFSISSVSGSYDSDRFRMVFKKLAPVPVTFVDIKAEKQKDAVKVSWKVENEINVRNYTVERSANGRNFTEMGTVPATGSSLYSLLDNNPLNGDNFYRVKSIGASGEIKYSKIVKISFQLVSSITIYPNPILSDKVAHVSFRNLPQGEYFVNVMNELGQIVWRKTISHTGGIAEYAIILDKNLAHGNYQMEISNQESLKTILKFLY